MKQKVIRIVSEVISESVTYKLQNYLYSKPYTVRLHIREYFPIGDAMLPFLWGLSRQFDLGLILISQSDRSRLWIFKELKTQHRLGNCLNVYPVFQTQANVPQWWNDEAREFFVINNSLVRDLTKIIELINYY